ncbi:hypothetical protein [Saccharothrix syringae]|uniref:Uncharacterized protein n=1 Tax=Saccharothrix syringae TaxID=103733 RepID=A0A5Q0H2J5_SACSY|nr:hypothetical protein [Saccharothrix syringae]QFZ20094.1 hypothetical protein EKG83_24130 [Saccharothrix syringae]
MGDRIIPDLAFGAPPAAPPVARPAASMKPPAPPRHDGDVAGRRDPVDDDRLALRAGAAPGRRELDLRRTEAPGPGALAVRREPLPRRHAVRAFDGKGRISDRSLFGALGWSGRMAVSIHAHESGALVVRRDPDGVSALTARGMVAVPAPVLRWCGFAVREQVLLTAVPSLSALVVHGLEALDRLLPDAERMVARVCPVRDGAGVGAGSGVVARSWGGEAAGV